jgi:hypothetical protein
MLDYAGLRHELPLRGPPVHKRAAPETHDFGPGCWHVVENDMALSFVSLGELNSKEKNASILNRSKAVCQLNGCVDNAQLANTVLATCELCDYIK